MSSKGSIGSADRAPRMSGLAFDASRPSPLAQPLSPSFYSGYTSPLASSSAFDLPGHCLFLSEPHHLSVLSLTIDATTTISPAVAPLSPSLSPWLAAAAPDQTQDAAASARNGAPNAFPPPVAMHNQSRRGSHYPSSKRSSLAIPDSSVRLASSRPRSVEIGARAREAISGLGRRAREVAGTLERSPNIDALSHVTRHLNPDPSKLAVANHADDARGASSRPRTAESHQEATSVRVQRRFTAKLQSLTFGRDSRLASSASPLDIDVRSRVLLGLDEFDGAPSEPAPGATEAVDFITDPTPRTCAAHGGLSAAGSESGDDAALTGAQLHSARAPFDPTRLLLKIEPPVTQARHLWAAQHRDAPGADLCEERHRVNLRFRLRLCASASASSAPPTGKQQAYATPSSDKGLEEVLFVSADSTQKLIDAIDMASSALSSVEAAALEGVSRVVVNPAPVAGVPVRGARDCDFDWTWKPLGRSSPQGRFHEKGPGTGKCCCAFVELDASRTKAKVLAAFSFWIEVPPPPFRAASLSVAATGGEAAGRSDSLALVAALNRDIDRSDLFAHDATSPAASAAAGNGCRATAELAGSVESGSAAPALDVNHTEISLEDIENDSPVLRAAIANLDRRTATLKRVAKVALKAALDVRMRILTSMEAEDAFDEAMRDLCSLAPDTLLKLRFGFGDHARERLARYKRDQAAMIEQNVEQPLSRVVERCRRTQERVKSFEAESKSYYSHTQKWLSSRVTSDVGSSNAFAPISSAGVNGGGGGGGEKGGKQERADEKQKLRQLRFEHARLELFRALTKLHGGQAELELARCMLQLSQWHADAPNAIWGSDWPDTERAQTLRSLSAGVEAASSASVELTAAVKQRCDDVAERIRLAESHLNKGGDGEGMSYSATEDPDVSTDANGHAETPAEPEPSVVPKGPKQAGQKLRNFFGGLHLGKQGPSTPTRSHQSGQEAGAATATTATAFVATPSLFKAKGPAEAGIASEIKRKVSFRRQLSRSSSNAGVATSSSSSPAPMPPAKQGEAHDGEVRRTLSSRRGARQSVESPAKSRTAVDMAKSPLMEHVSIANEYLLAHAAALREVVRPSEKSAPSPDTGAAAAERAFNGSPAHKLDASSDSQRSDSTTGLGIGGLTVDGGGGAAPLPSSAPEPASARPAPKQVASGQERKKEGVLWVMSKPVTGPAGSDAPRAVNRAGHWRECWVVLSGSGHLGEYADWKDAKILEPSNPLIDLRFATVREARGVDRRFTFEVVTRDSRRFFQAPDEATMRDWIKAIARAIESLLNGTSSVRKLDRAVRAVPFKIDPALQSGLMAEEGNVDDFGTMPGRSDQEGASHRPFSQSMTDLTGDVREARKSVEAMAAVGSGRREGRRGGGHLSTLSESYTTSAWKQGPRDDKLKRSASKHERGISNKTPIYGYLNGNGSAIGLSGSRDGDGHHRQTSNVGEGVACSPYEADFELDRRIEEIVHSSFGKSSVESGVDEASVSSPITEMGRLQSPAQRPSQHASTTSTKMSRATEIIEISRRPENSLCADCRSPDPRWASWALGGQPCCIFICIGCSGVHRSLGVHISKVKSVDLDDWTEEQVDAARHWGNAKANEFWEHSKPSGLLPAEDDRHSFWKKKYIDAAWKRPEAKAPTPVRTPRSSAPANISPARDRKRFDLLTTHMPKPRSVSGQHAPQASTQVTPSDQDEPAAGQTSPRPTGPRPLLPSRSGSLMEQSTFATSESTHFPLSKAREASDSGRSPITASLKATSPSYGSPSRTAFGDGVRWPAPRPIDIEASRRRDSLFVTDLTSISPTSYDSEAQAYKTISMRMGLNGEGGDGNNVGGFYYDDD
ncbi:hypothetical protein ACQY0O_001363 [Thecaphora frezii]